MAEPETPLGREHTAMAAPIDHSGDSSSESPSPEISTRRLREQSQIDFEIDFLTRVLERDPFFVAGLRAHANNLAAKGLHARCLQIDRRLVRLIPEDAIAWYNLACSYAVLGMVEPAFSALQRSLELGYRSVKRLRRDPDLKALRRDRRFARLLHRYQLII
jgi:tetratricopeptide (TPR) repeat protein